MPRKQCESCNNKHYMPRIQCESCNDKHYKSLGADFQPTCYFLNRQKPLFSIKCKYMGKGESKKILLIDDDPTFIDISTRAFKEAGIAYITAFNGIEALEKATSEKPVLILLDIMMPGIDGFAVLNNLKKGPATAKTPVWMITNLPGEMNKELAISLGATDYLVKAENTPSKICEKVNSFLAST